jgi:hypothetical protein
MRRLAAFSLLTLAVIAASGCLAAPPETVHPGNSTAAFSETALLAAASRDAAVSDFIAGNPGYKYNITELSASDIASLSQKYPVIYGGLPAKTLYSIQYTGERGLLVIADRESGEVLKSFRTLGVTLG